jgi:hypothetical protein
MNKFYFNTGVRPETVSNFPYDYHKEKGNVIRGTLLIPFECDAPEDAKLMFLCGNPNLDEAKSKNVIVREVFNTNMASKYAYLKIK